MVHSSYGLAAGALAALMLSGCFRMGMPEYIASVPPLQPPHTPAALLITADRELGPGRPETLGYQFVFGIMPVTRLYLEHGIAGAVQEAAYAVLQEQGYRVYSTELSNTARAASLLRPRMIVSAAVSDFSLNAYDLLLLRVLSIDGILHVKRYTGSGRPAGGVSASLREHRYRRSGHAALLASLLESRLREAMREVLVRRMTGRRRPKTAARKEPLLLIEPPQSFEEPDESIGKTAADSYGFHGLPAFPPAAVRRMVQRGFAAGLDRAAAVMAPPLSAADPIVQSGSWVLRSELKKILLLPPGGKREAGVRLALRFQLLDRGRQLLAADCTVFEPLHSGRDGYWVVTIEHAAGQVAQQFMSLDASSEPQEGMRCSRRTR